MYNGDGWKAVKDRDSRDRQTERDRERERERERDVIKEIIESRE
jgi:hypothetical protein